MHIIIKSKMNQICKMPTYVHKYIHIHIHCYCIILLAKLQWFHAQNKSHTYLHTITFILYTYTVLHIFRQVLSGAGNQGNHQNFEKSLLTNKLWHVLMGMKQKKIFFFEIFFSKWPTKKKLIFQFRQFSIFFCENFIDWSFG